MFSISRRGLSRLSTSHLSPLRFSRVKQSTEGVKASSESAISDTTALAPTPVAEAAQTPEKPRSFLSKWGGRIAIATIGGTIGFLMYQTHLKSSYPFQKSFQRVIWNDLVQETIGDPTEIRYPRWHETFKGDFALGWMRTEPNWKSGKAKMKYPIISAEGERGYVFAELSKRSVAVWDWDCDYLQVTIKVNGEWQDVVIMDTVASLPSDNDHVEELDRV